MILFTLLTGCPTSTVSHAFIDLDFKFNDIGVSFDNVATGCECATLCEQYTGPQKCRAWTLLKDRGGACILKTPFACPTCEAGFVAAVTYAANAENCGGADCLISQSVSGASWIQNDPIESVADVSSGCACARLCEQYSGAKKCGRWILDGSTCFLDAPYSGWPAGVAETGYVDYINEAGTQQCVN